MNRNINQPLISIIIPVFNVENYITHCLNSVINATKESTNYTFEIIIIDDCGKDKSIQKVEKIQKEHQELIQIYKNDVNKGSGGARNTGIEKAKGEYIQFVDADDWLENNLFSELIPILLENPDTILIYGLESIKKGKKVWELIPKYEGKYTSNEALHFISIDEISVSPCNKIFPAKLFNSLRFSEGMIYEDLDLIPLIVEKSEFVIFVQSSYYNYRQDGKSLTRTTTSDNHILDGDKAVQNLISSLDTNTSKGNFFFNRWSYFLKKWEVSDEKYLEIFSILIKNLNKYALKGFEASQIKLFLDQVNLFESKIGKEMIINLKMALIKSISDIPKSGPLFSIISPVYNNSKYLKRFFESINKDYSQFYEIILVDDQSEDESFSQIKKFEKDFPYVHAFEMEKKGGAGGARNFGLNKAKGSYIIFWDSDDWLEENYFDEIIDCLISSNLPEMIIHSFQVVDNSNEILWINQKYYELPYYNYSGKEIFSFFANEFINPAPWNKVIKKSLFENPEVCFPEQIFHQDLALIPYLFLKSESISFIKIPLYNYFENPSGITKRSSQKHINSIFQAIENLNNLIINNCENYQKSEQLKIAFRNYLYNFNIRKDAYSKDQILSFHDQLAEAVKKMDIDFLTLLNEENGRKLYSALKLECESKGIYFNLIDSVSESDSSEVFELISNLIYQNRLGINGGSNSSQASISATTASNLQNSLDWYSRTYDHLPKWYLKPGGIFRRKPFKKK